MSGCRLDQMAWQTSCVAKSSFPAHAIHHACKEFEKDIMLGVTFRVVQLLTVGNGTL